MIGLRSSVKLAVTKIKAKKGLTTSTIIINGLIMSVLVAIVVGFTGISHSFNDFIKTAGGNNYWVAVTPHYPSSIIDKYATNPTNQTIDQVRQYEQNYQKLQQARYAQAGLAYDASADTPALTKAEWMGSNVSEKYRYKVNLQSPAVLEMISQDWIAWAKTTQNKTSNLMALAKTYGATEFYKTTSSQYDQDLTKEHLFFSNTAVIVDGKEKIANWLGDSATSNNITNSLYHSIDRQVLNRYITKNDNLSGVPVIVSARDIAELYGDKLGLAKKEPTDAKERNVWFNDVKAKASGFTYQVCYRNATERNMLSRANQASVEMDSNKDDPDYTAPSLRYGFPATPCGDIPVLFDTRTTLEKAADDAEIAKAKKLGMYLAPVHELIKFQVVGVVNDKGLSIDLTRDRSINPSDYTSDLLSKKASLANLGLGVIIPSEMYDNLPNNLKVPDLGIKEQATSIDIPVEVAQQFSSGVLEFSSLDGARKFIDNETSKFNDSQTDKLYEADQFGVNYLAVNDLNQLFGTCVMVVVPIVAIFLIVIVWFTISRIMADSRYEIAIYRAVGAKRLDIAVIYLTYAVVMGVLIAGVAIPIGLISLVALDKCLAPQITSTIQVALSITGTNAVFRLLIVNVRTILSCLCLIGGTALICVLSSVIPIIRNTRRPPVVDLHVG